MGSRYARVFPLPVTASTTTSLCAMNNGIVDAWTGVIRSKPIADVAVRIQSASGGVRASHARDELDFDAAPLSGAMMFLEHRLHDSEIDAS